MVFWAKSNAVLSKKIDQQNQKIEVLADKIDETNKNQIDILKETYSSNYEGLKDSFTIFLEVLSIILVLLWGTAGILWFFGFKDINKLRADYKEWLATMKDLLKNMEWDYSNFKNKSEEILEKATPQDIKEKEQEETVDSDKIKGINDHETLISNEKNNQKGTREEKEEQFKLRKTRLMNIEKQWLLLIRWLCFLEEWWLHYQEWYKITNEIWTFIPDAIISDSNKTIRLWVELKYVWESTMPLQMLIRRYIERIRFYKFDFPFVIAIIGKNINYEDADKYFKEFSYDDIKILFMNYDEVNNKVIPVNTVGFSKMISLLREWDMVRHKLFWKGRILETSNGMSMVKFDSHGGLRRIENAFLTRLI